MRPFPSGFLLTFAPPGRFAAHGFRLQDEALGLYDVEEQLADHVGIAGVGHFQAGAESAGRINGKYVRRFQVIV